MLSVSISAASSAVIATSPWQSFLIAVAVLGGLASIIGIPLAYYLARRGRQNPRLQYTTDFDVLVDPDGFASEGNLTLHGHAIHAVSRSYVAFAHRGGDTVSGADIVEADPFRLQFGDADRVLQARLLYYSRDACAISLTPSANAVAINFDFLDPGDGGIIEAIHEATTPPRLLGTIRGATYRARPATATLTPAAIDWMRYAGRRERLRRRTRTGMDRLAGTRRRLVLALLILQLVALLVIFGVDVARHWNPDLINPAAYNLKTLEGQKDFADEVQKRGLGDTFWKTLVFAFGFGIGALASFFSLLFGWRSIPRSIVANRASGAASSELVSPKSEPDDVVSA
jgi:hypothetical protein